MVQTQILCDERPGGKVPLCFGRRGILPTRVVCRSMTARILPLLAWLGTARGRRWRDAVRHGSPVRAPLGALGGQPLFVAERLDGIEVGGLDGGEEPE